MAIADGYQYGFPQQRMLEMMRSEHCNHTMYQFFKEKSLKLEAKLCHREEEVSSAEAVISAKDKEILELNNRLKGKEKLGAKKEKLCVELALVRSELEKAGNNVSSSKVGDVRELTWLRSERTRQVSRIQELVMKIKGEAEKWNARADEHNELAARHRERREHMVDMQNKYNSDRCLFNGALLWTRENLREAHENISRLEAKVAGLEEELHQARSSHDPKVQDYIQRLVRERDDAIAEDFALSNSLTASRAHVARLVDYEKDLEVNMYKLSEGIENINNKVDLIRHLDSMKQEYVFIDEARDAVINEYEIASTRVEELEGKLLAANEKPEKAQSSLMQQEIQTTYYKGFAGSQDEAAKEAGKEVTRLSSLLSQAELKKTIIAYKDRFQLTKEINKTLTRIEHDLQAEHSIVKNYPRRPIPEPLTYSSGPSSGGSVPSSQKKNPTDHVESSKGK
ncbi:myosin heavy chain, embryonic smooth muscle isoform-like [Papaver somniferum]|uniref:myosin heavy chain, embryonic smooth muscle isoform-like n=1 Tax=Papaver somniferum TaxID=3469 RepID=UPI000E6F834D|nr:myosin heavy chain, embryonic smooth muscle isoform-like [Papaver somniferum]